MPPPRGRSRGAARTATAAASPPAHAVDSYRLPTAIASDDDPRHAAVYRLADQGRSSPQIAAELVRPSGEIELILALRNKKQG